MSGDPEFDDFLQRRRPLFRREVDDGLEPPPELDRIVLRQAREAIESERPLRLFGMPRWAAPMAIAATLVVGLAFVFRTGMGPVERIPDVKVESIAQRMDYPPAQAATPPAPPPPAPAAENFDGASHAPVVVTLTPSPAPALVLDGNAPGRVTIGAKSTVVANDLPSWRQDPRTWQAEIDRLRASGDRARADAEQAEFNRQYRAMATSPDR